MTGPYCEECESRSESRKKVNSENARSSVEEGGTRRGSGIAGERVEVETEWVFCKRDRHVELQLSPCSWEQYL